MLKAGYEDKGRRYETPRGTPQGGVVLPLLSNILLTPFDKEMRHKGYQLTRWADDWAAMFNRPRRNRPWRKQQRSSKNLA